MDGMQMDGMPGMSMAQPQDLRGAILAHTASGTTVEPPYTPMPMVLRERGRWMLMLHGKRLPRQHPSSRPRSPSPPTDRRGADKLFSTNWIMPMAMRPLGPGELTLRAMFSLEPATITGRFYPELFQQGETAFGVPIVDGQHPHDFFMEVRRPLRLEDQRANTPQLLRRSHRRPRHRPHRLPPPHVLV